MQILLTPRLEPAPEEAAPQAAAAAAAGAHRAPSSRPPAAPAGRQALAAPSAPEGPPSAAAPLAPDGGAGAAAGPADAVRGALRGGVGCGISGGALGRLTPEEKERCLQRFGANARQGPAYIDPIPREKREYYDAVQAAYQAAHDPAHNLIRDAHGNLVAWGHGPGVGCGMKFGGPPAKPDHRSLTDKIKGDGGIFVPVGPLQCGVMLPQGSLTPELGIPVP